MTLTSGTTTGGESSMKDLLQALEPRPFQLLLLGIAGYLTLWIAIFNGYPVFFADTGECLWDSFTLQPPVYRSILYSLKRCAALPHKVRTNIRKGIKSDLTADFGGEQLLDAFYGVFARNMRDLGTPVYGRHFFSEIFRTFPDDTCICVVRHRGKPIAASFLTGYRGTLEAAWSSSLYSHISMKPNMFLYWKILCFAGERGYQLFDFGRSTIGSGTHRFKEQWGSQDIPLYWVYWVPEGADLPELNIDNPRYRLAIWLWQRLPVSVTKVVGPAIVKCLP